MVVKGRTAAALLAGGILLAAGCGSSSSTASELCSAEQRQQLDFRDDHLEVADPEPSYDSEPPTSGPHVVVGDVPEEFASPLPGHVQVGILESGRVLVQYRVDLPVEQVEELKALASPEASVAPNPELDDPVVVTAWLHVQRCEAVDVDTIEAFIDRHAGDRVDA